MKLTDLPINRILPYCVLAAALAYALFYFNYFETPTGDYIGNIRGPVLDYMKGNFPGQNFKFLPLYPLLLSLFTRLNPLAVFDRIYLTAMILNIILFVPYVFIVLQIYRRFLPEKTALLSFIFLSVNIYTVYTAVNSELEMLLSLLMLLSLYLTMRDSKISYLTAFMAAITKWDSVFIIPAVMFRDFFYRKRMIISILLGAIATSGIAAWFILSMIDTSGHPYISEIAHRGPNIYKFIIDCFLVSSGFIQWMAMQGYFADNLAAKITLLGFCVIPGTLVITSIIWGITLIIKEKRREFAPIFVFFFGFVLIHLIYQNTKDRYVLPVLWILNLFMCCGFACGLLPWIKKIYGTFTDKAQRALSAISAAGTSSLYLAGLGAIAVEHSIAHVLLALLFTALAAAVIMQGRPDKKQFNSWLALLAAGAVINLTVFYGVHLMDHHSLSRVEFKKAALWYSGHAAASDRMLMAETNVPKYYSGFGDEKFVISYLIKGNTIAELIPELREKKVTYVFVDDFYIRRLAYRDPNAIDRKAWIFKEIRDRGEKSGHFKLLETFHTKGGITSYLYQFIP
jgi:hypothetical protein